MRTFGLIALAGAGIGYMLYRNRNRAMAGMTPPQMVNDPTAHAVMEDTVEDVLEQPHPDTAVTHAFKEAVA